MDFATFKQLVSVMVKTQTKKWSDELTIKAAAFLRELADSIDPAHRKDDDAEESTQG